ncbi:MAG TPA: hypothetical protein P5514_12360 [Bacteroidales bacterium]|nr:hypothetical protein [Bacteroidales bacterium]
MQGAKRPSYDLGLTANFKRKIKSGDQFDHLFPKPDYKDTLLQEGNVYDTLLLMGDYIQKYKTDTAKIAPILRGKTLEETLRNDWNFVYHHIQYKLDTPGVEELRRPARSWAERKTGVDCDCYTIFLCTLLLNQGIEPVIRIVQIPPATSFHHVYPIVYKNGRSGAYYTLDAVLDRFNEEKPFSKKQDYSMNDLGIPIKGLHGIPVNIMSDSKSDDEILARLVATKDIVESYPASIAPFENPERFLQELKYAIKNWNTPNRSKALEILANRENQLNEIHPLNGLIEEVDDLDDMTRVQVEAVADLLSGDHYGLEGVVNGEELGKFLRSKHRKLVLREAGLKRNLKHTPKRFHHHLKRKINRISKLKDRIEQVKALDEQGKEKAAQLIRKTYHIPEVTRIQKNNSQDSESSENLAPRQSFDVAPIVNNEFQEYDTAVSFEDENPSNLYLPADSYLEDPYDEWMELIEDYLDDIEDIEDDIALDEISEINGLGMVELGAFWHKREKRLKLKQKRQEKRLTKAQKKGKTKQATRLKTKLEKNKIKQQDPQKWKEVRTAWRKDNNRGFWNGIQKAGQGAINALVKYNPVSIAARNGFLAALKLNVKKISSRLKWGYASKEQAIKHGMSAQRWQQSKQALAKVEDLFVKKTKGSKTALKNAILKGGKGLNGPALAGPELAAMAAAATPLIIAAVKILQQSGILDPGVKIEKVEEDLKNGDLENTSDIPSSQYDDIQLDVSVPWYQNPVVKTVGIAGGGLLLLGVGYAAMHKKTEPKPKPANQLSGPGKPVNKKAKAAKPQNQKAKDEPIKEIILT